MFHAARVREMYATYAPHKLDQVDNLLRKYHGVEDAVIAALVKKYGPEPETVHCSHHDDLLCRVQSIFEAHAPQKVYTAVSLCENCGDGDALISTLVAKFGPEPFKPNLHPECAILCAHPEGDILPMTCDAGCESWSGNISRLRSRVEAIYEHHAPQRLGNIPHLFTKYAGNEQGLLDAIVRKYGTEPI